MMDLGAQPIMIGKKLAHELRLTADDLAPYPFTIVTSIGHVERATGYTWEPLELSFRVKPRDPSIHLFLKCEVTNATNYNILIDHQAFYPFDFGLDNGIEEAWIQPGWSAGDGRRELIPVAFVAAITIAPLSMVLGVVFLFTHCHLVLYYWRIHWHLWECEAKPTTLKRPNPGDGFENHMSCNDN